MRSTDAVGPLVEENVMEQSQPIHLDETAALHNPKRTVQSRPTDFVSPDIVHMTVPSS